MRPWTTKRAWIFRTAVWGAIAVLPAACTPPDTFPPACPVMRLLPDAADLTTFNGHGQDVTDTLFAARITEAPGTCKAGGHRIVNATMNVVMVVVRGPALVGRTAEVPYFVTVMDGNQMLQQKDYVMGVAFPPNVDQGKATSEDISLDFPVTQEKSAAAYTIYVGMRLTQEQLQYNRRNRTP